MFKHLAANPKISNGRLHHEYDDDQFRTPFERDRGRVIHSSSFRKLKHKTQVFIESESDYYRTRLTHSLEVAQISKSLSRILGLNEDLCEIVALAHDLGHPPFGHNGEKALNTSMSSQGGFNHNDQTLRVITYIEKRNPKFNGLNRTWESLEGIVKHNGPLVRADHHLPLPRSIETYIEKQDLEQKYKSLVEEYNNLSAKMDEIQNQEKIEIKKQEQFSEKIDELNQETDSLLDEIDKWQT